MTSTAAQVVAAINASPAASALVVAYTYRGNAGTGVVAAGSAALSDGLSAPASVSRDPQPVYAIRIGTTRDGSKPGVLLFLAGLTCGATCYLLRMRTTRGLRARIGMYDEPVAAEVLGGTLPDPQLVPPRST